MIDLLNDAWPWSLIAVALLACIVDQALLWRKEHFWRVALREYRREKSASFAHRYAEILTPEGNLKPVSEESPPVELVAPEITAASIDVSSIKILRFPSPPNRDDGKVSENTD